MLQNARERQPLRRERFRRGGEALSHPVRRSHAIGPTRARFRIDIIGRRDGQHDCERLRLAIASAASKTRRCRPLPWRSSQRAAAGRASPSRKAGPMDIAIRGTARVENPAKTASPTMARPAGRPCPCDPLLWRDKPATSRQVRDRWAAILGRSDNCRCYWGCRTSSGRSRRPSTGSRSSG